MDFLRHCQENGKLSHAYLFVGPEGIGKRRVAQELVNWCLERKEATVDLGHDFQVKFLERIYDEKTGKKHKDISINQIHEVREFFNHHSFLGGYQIAVISEAEKMSIKAQNALLKTLEEPAGQSLIILLTVDEKKLLPTIASRCQIIRFYPVSNKEIYEALVQKGANRELALEIARLSFGSPGRAIILLEDPSQMEFYQQEGERFLNLLKGELVSRFNRVEELFKENKEADSIETRDKLSRILRLWQGLWRDILVCQSGAPELASHLTLAEALKQHVKRYSVEQIVLINQKIEAAIQLLKQNIHPKLIFENLILSFY